MPIHIKFEIIHIEILQIFRTSFNINTLSEKKNFCHGFSPFFNGLSQTPIPHPLNNQNPVVTKKFLGNAPSAMAMEFQPICKKYTL